MLSVYGVYHANLHEYITQASTSCPTASVLQIRGHGFCATSFSNCKASKSLETMEDTIFPFGGLRNLHWASSVGVELQASRGVLHINRMFQDVHGDISYIHAHTYKHTYIHIHTKFMLCMYVTCPKPDCDRRGFRTTCELLFPGSRASHQDCVASIAACFFQKLLCPNRRPTEDPKP